MNPQILNRFSNIRLPEWDELPDLDLYMDQVISLLQRYLGQFPSPDEKGITSSMINNYVKQGVIPPPKKKRYTRIHLAYLIMVYILKSALSISHIRLLLEKELSSQDLSSFYTSFRETFRSTMSASISRYCDLDSDALSLSSTAAISAYVEQSISYACWTPDKTE